VPLCICLQVMDMAQNNLRNIQGIWSADLQYSPGAACDDRFIFLESGIGFYEQINWGLCGYERFRYKIMNGATLLMESNQAFMNDGNDHFEPDDELYVGPRQISFEIVEVQSPVFGPIPFLRFLDFQVNHQSQFGFCRLVEGDYDPEAPV
jgi:hypothetical protein